MRNSHYSSYEDDFEPVRPARRRTSRKNLPIWKRALNTVMRNPKRLLVGMLFAGVAVSVGANALMMQSSRHPAPMFYPRVATREPQVPQVPPACPAAKAQRTPAVQTLAPAQAQVPVPAAVANNNASAERDTIGDIIRTGSTSAPPATHSVVPTAKAQPTDVIGDLIRMNGVPPARPGEQRPVSAETTGNAKIAHTSLSAEENRRNVIMTGQQALNKLGYGPLDADGVLGSGTKKAIEHFEFDRRLPVTGTFNTRTVGELSSRSRIAIR